MKKDLDVLMQDQRLDAVMISGSGRHNPAMVYFTGGAHLTSADFIKPVNNPGFLFHGPMERDEAKKTGQNTVSYSKFPFDEFLLKHAGNRVKAFANRYQMMLQEAGIHKGKIALYGLIDMGFSHNVFSELERFMPEVEFVSGVTNDFLLRARATKDELEIRRIQNMGKITVEVVGNTADFLSGHKIRNNRLIQKNGEWLTIGEVKQKINLWLAEKGAENPHGTIFAAGYDSSVPHSDGKNESPLELGQTLVFDIFPCEIGGGYFYDFTRTWCLGYAPDEAEKLYEEVKSVYQNLVQSLEADMLFSLCQQKTCDLFESLGHPTMRTNSTTEMGYVHSVGHGIGLQVHELPTSGSTSTDEDRLTPGSVFTIEPGLYYPNKNMGVRIENSLAVMSDKKIIVLADYPLDLVLPVRNSL